MSTIDLPDRSALSTTYLENRFRMRPTGVVSKKDIGDRKMAYAIRSCNFREACKEPLLVYARPGETVLCNVTLCWSGAFIRAQGISRDFSPLSSRKSREARSRKITQCRVSLLSCDPVATLCNGKVPGRHDVKGKPVAIS
jgi:hypothetical protein